MMDRGLGNLARPKAQKVKKNGRFDSSDSSDEDAEAQVPIGFDYSDNFPSLPDFDGKGKQIRQAEERRKRLQNAGGQWGSES